MRRRFSANPATSTAVCRFRERFRRTSSRPLKPPPLRRDDRQNPGFALVCPGWRRPPLPPAIPLSIFEIVRFPSVKTEPTVFAFAYVPRSRYIPRNERLPKGVFRDCHGVSIGSWGAVAQKLSGKTRNNTGRSTCESIGLFALVPGNINASAAAGGRLSLPKVVFVYNQQRTRRFARGGCMAGN